MSEVTGPIIATTAVLMAVFVPVAFIPALPGASTISSPDGRDLGRNSAFNSLTLSPALSAAFLRHRPPGNFRRSAGSTPV